MDTERDVVFGHEFVGEVVANGPGTEGKFKPGDLVTSMPLTIAGSTVLGMGYNPDLPGGFAEYMPLAERMLLPLPATMEPDHAALTEPMAVWCRNWVVGHVSMQPRLDLLYVPCGLGKTPIPTRT
jgi:threonine dehydrogenase-like Zn-dependent dehydrogenase